MTELQRKGDQFLKFCDGVRSCMSKSRRMPVATGITQSQKHKARSTMIKGMVVTKRAKVSIRWRDSFRMLYSFGFIGLVSSESAMNCTWQTSTREVFSNPASSQLWPCILPFISARIYQDKDDRSQLSWHGCIKRNDDTSSHLRTGGQKALRPKKPRAYHPTFAQSASTIDFRNVS